MFVDHCSKNINCCFRSSWQSKFSKDMEKLIQKNGDICCQVLQDKFIFHKTQQLGYLKINGQTFTDSFMEQVSSKSWREFRIIWWNILINGKKYLTVLFLKMNSCLNPIIHRWTNSKKLLSLNQSDQTRWFLPFKTMLA